MIESNGDKKSNNSIPVLVARKELKKEKPPYIWNHRVFGNAENPLI